MATAHPIVHVDIPAGDLNTTANFYRDALGWNINNSMPSYPMFSVEGGPGGGFVESGSAGLGSVMEGVVIYLSTSDIDASLREVEGHGGRTVRPRTEIEGGHGAFAIFKDPSGNMLGLYQPPSG